MAKGISLHIGLNSVDPDHYAGWPGPLNACEADASDMEALASAQGFTPTTLLTAAATRERVTAAIEAAAASLSRGDIFLLTYSGHGGQLPDRNYDESDLMDETWCLFDGEIVDDELSALYAGFAAGVRILILSDSCHSGTVSKLRALGVESDANTDEVTGAQYRAMPILAADRTYRRNKSFYDPILTRPVAPRPKASILLLSGCQDTQLSLDGTFNGMFTGMLLRVWRSGAFVGDYRRFHRQIVKQMPATQVPNYFFDGTPDPSFEAQRPFTI